MCVRHMSYFLAFKFISNAVMIIVIIEYNLNVVNYEIFGKLKITIKYLSAVPA